MLTGLHLKGAAEDALLRLSERLIRICLYLAVEADKDNTTKRAPLACKYKHTLKTNRASFERQSDKWQTRQRWKGISTISGARDKY